jgi:AcrR family transcriptional regulator
MATRTDPGPRSPLSRERLLDAAIALADEGGIESLSMRKLAQKLGVEAMSLYHYVAKKDDILDGIVDLVMEEIAIPPTRGDWKEELRQIAVTAHDALVRHPWACSLMWTTSISPARLRYMESILGRLRESGFSPELTHHAYHALESHISGFTLWQVNIPFKAEDIADLGAAFLRELPIDEYPYVAEHTEQHLQPSSPEEKSEFEFGLDLILDGLERLRDTHLNSD